MEIFVIVRRKKLSLYVAARDNMQVLDLKNTVGSIIKEEPTQLQLFYNDLILSDNMKLSDCGLTHPNAMAHVPATLGLALMLPNNQFEELEMTAFSTPPELPPQMRNNDIAPVQQEGNDEFNFGGGIFIK